MKQETDLAEVGDQGLRAARGMLQAATAAQEHFEFTMEQAKHQMQVDADIVAAGEEAACAGKVMNERAQSAHSDLENEIDDSKAHLDTARDRVTEQLRAAGDRLRSMGARMRGELERAAEDMLAEIFEANEKVLLVHACDEMLAAGEAARAHGAEIHDCAAKAQADLDRDLASALDKAEHVKQETREAVDGAVQQAQAAAQNLCAAAEAAQRRFDAIVDEGIAELRALLGRGPTDEAGDGLDGPESRGPPAADLRGAMLKETLESTQGKLAAFMASCRGCDRWDLGNGSASGADLQDDQGRGAAEPSNLSGASMSRASVTEELGVKNSAHAYERGNGQSQAADKEAGKHSTFQVHVQAREA